MKSFKEIYEEAAMSVSQLGAGDLEDGVLGPNDYRMPKKIGKLQKRKSLDDEEELDEKTQTPIMWIADKLERDGYDIKYTAIDTIPAIRKAFKLNMNNMEKTVDYIKAKNIKLT